MLIEFSAANFRCFKERVTLSLEAESRISERDKSVDQRNIADTPEGQLLRVVGIYGANASGKSNLLRAMQTLSSLVLDSAREGQAGDLLPVDPFRLDAQTRREPSELEVVFSHQGVQYRYGVAATTERVEREWLLTCTVIDREDEQLWFERNGDVYEVGPGWHRDESIERKTRPAALHLSVAAQFNHAQAMSVLRWFLQLHLVDSARGTSSRSSRSTIDLLDHQAHGATIRELVRRLDFGIDDIRVVRPAPSPDTFWGRSWGEFTWPSASLAQSGLPQPQIISTRDGVDFNLYREESAGTIKAFELAGSLVQALAQGGVIIIDEFDARLHTLLAKQLVELFQDPQTNPHDAQLVFASHDTNLLTRTLLRRDQLWFVEKSRKTHATDLYSLAELRLEDGKGIRNDARYEADYLQGKYGAIPFFGSLEGLLGESEDEG